MSTSTATTRGVLVEVESEYVEERSDPEQNRYFFAYHIRITNKSDETVKLISRHWTITNSDGASEEVQGPGVVGEQPRLDPGESFEYTSFCPLTTPVGVMQGTYQMVTDDEESFDAVIAPFTLSKEEVVYH
ncbi:MAG: Co2+/Mg2+ efflux protein ApaG [Deltaproteobacteria bacterium]|nr:MAG: Co2+/Mg2+ efflux protein ApaG [Deltaproteobacteria bacterium]